VEGTGLPHLKNSSRLNYDYFFRKYLVPQLGKRRVDELETMELQAFFNSFIGTLRRRRSRICMQRYVLH
jgi:hypothetical protein